MSQQATAKTPQPAEAKNPFADSAPKLTVAVDNSETIITEKIVNAKKPIIIITEDMAESMGQLSHYMFDTFPNTPVIFESKQAERIFNAAKWSDRCRASVQIVGHFTNNADGRAINSPESVDAVIVFGEPTQAMQETFPQAKFFTYKQNKHVNLAVINRMRQEKMTP